MEFYYIWKRDMMLLYNSTARLVERGLSIHLDTCELMHEVLLCSEIYTLSKFVINFGVIYLK